MNVGIEKYIPRGRDNAISRKDLVMLTGMDDRTVRACISQVRENGKPICANTVTGGYYMAETEEDIKHLLGDLRSRISKLCKCYAAVKGTGIWKGLVS